MRLKLQTIGQRTGIGFLALLPLVLALGAGAVWCIHSLEREVTGTISQVFNRLASSAEYRVALAEMVAGQRAAVLWALKDEQAEFKETVTDYREAERRVLQSIDEYANAGQLSADETKVVDSLRADLSRWRTEFDRIVALCEVGDIAAASAVEAGLEPQTAAMMLSASQLGGAQRADFGNALRHTGNLAESGAMWIIALGLLATAGVPLALWFTLAGVKTQLSGIADSIGNGVSLVLRSSSDVSDSSATLAQSAAEQAASLEQTASSASQLRDMTTANAEHSKQSAELMVQTEQTIHLANQALDTLTRSMSEIDSSSRAISKIIQVIDEIAFQTNLLSLNAAVEAARAGDAGRGFAVVADEVRNLAQRSGQAAKETSVLIKTSIARAKDGSDSLAKVVSNMSAITNHALSAKTLVDEVNLGSQQQAAGTLEISSVVDRLVGVTQQVAATAEESAATGMSLRAHSGIVADAARGLRVLIANPAGGDQPDPS